MTIVSTGVHPAGMSACIGQAGHLLDRKRIDVGPQSHARLGWIADQADRGRRGVGHAVNMLQSQAIQLGPDHRGCLEFPKGEFGNAMKAMPQVCRLRGAGFDGGVEIHVGGMIPRSFADCSPP